MRSALVVWLGTRSNNPGRAIGVGPRMAAPASRLLWNGCSRRGAFRDTLQDLWMNDRQLARSRAFVLLPELGLGVQQRLLGEEKGVLGVPDLYLMLVPYLRSDAIDGDEPMAPKVRRPVVGPLLVDMLSPRSGWRPRTGPPAQARPVPRRGVWPSPWGDAVPLRGTRRGRTSCPASLLHEDQPRRIALTGTPAALHSRVGHPRPRHPRCRAPETRSARRHVHNRHHRPRVAAGAPPPAEPPSRAEFLIGSWLGSKLSLVYGDSGTRRASLASVTARRCAISLVTE